METGDGCWPWKLNRLPRGYGVTRLNKIGTTAHRVAWMLANGPIPDGMIVCHRCDNPPCCNPAHLFVGTHQDNTDDMLSKGRGATGDRNGSRRHPERHKSKTRPESVVRGERVNTAKLTAEKVREIRQRHASGETDHRALASEYGVRCGNIWFIVKGLTWRHVLPSMACASSQN